MVSWIPTCERERMFSIMNSVIQQSERTVIWALLGIEILLMIRKVILISMMHSNYSNSKTIYRKFYTTIDCCNPAGGDVTVPLNSMIQHHPAAQIIRIYYQQASTISRCMMPTGATTVTCACDRA